MHAHPWAYFKGRVQSLDHSRCTLLHSKQLEMVIGKFGKDHQIKNSPI